MKAYRIFQNGKMGAGKIVDMEIGDLDPGEVLIRTFYCGVNYKDALAGLGGAPIVRRYPCNCGIEVFGQVETSDRSDFMPGEMVLAHGHGIGVTHDGGMAEFLRLPAEWAQKLPEGLGLKEAATLGVAGYSAALAVDRMEELGLTPENGPVAVTGATGGVGSFAVAMLARREFSVTAVTSKPEAADWLRDRGAADVIAVPEPSTRPLEKGVWAGAVDATGGAPLEWLLKTVRPNAVIASIGNAAGRNLSTTVLPFILRGVTLTGINADSPAPLRARIWKRLAGDLRPDGLLHPKRTLGLDELPAYLEQMIAGRITGRAILSFGGGE